MNNDLVQRLAQFVKDKHALNVPNLAKKIEKHFGSPLLDGATELGNGKKLSKNAKRTIKSLFRQQPNIYNTVVYLLRSHLNWLNIYCKEAFDSDNPNFGSTSTLNDINTTENIRKKILNYMNKKHKLNIENCTENTTIRDLITYDSTESMDEKLRTAYMFLSMFRITQSSKSGVDNTKNYCILLNEFMTNLEKLLVVNNKITKTTTKRILFLSKPINNKIKKKKEEYNSNLSDISSLGIREYGVFILENIINKIFFPDT
jgi:hypothetical protein